MATLHIDFETQSEADLKKVGTANYAAHPSTKVLCLGYAFDDDEPCIIADTELPRHIADHITDGGEVVAHNAAFELAIWREVCAKRYGWPTLTIDQMRCTMAQAYAMGLPGSLEQAAAAVGIDMQKDMQGSRIMLQLCKPKADGSLWKYADSPGKFDRLYEYCLQDVRTERALDKRLMRLSPEEQQMWEFDQIINNRGVYVDLASIDKAIALVDAEVANLNARMLQVTGGVVGKCTKVRLLVRWMRSQGVTLPGLAKSDVIDALKLDDLPPAVRQALQLRQEAAKSSTAKLVAMRERASSDSRVRGCFQFHGAATGRWAHRGIQPGNLPRPRVGIKPKHIADIIANLDDREYVDMVYGPTMDAMADCIRGMIMAPPGYDLVAMDYSAIEARVLAWLAGEEKVLDIFRGHARIYEHAASGIYNVPIDAVDKDQRQIGKVAVLALGYGGGVGAFQSLAKVYGVRVEDSRADEIKKAWREAHPRIVRYWYELEAAAINAVEYGVVCKAGPEGRQVAFRTAGSFLWCKLPSGRVLCYPYPVIRAVQTPWGETKAALYYMAVNGVTKKWEETSTYGGALAENVTQAVAACLLRDGIKGVEDAGYRTVMHVHDEVVVEIPSDCGPWAEEKIQAAMETVPEWAAGLPLAAEGWRAKRYRK